MKNLLIESHCIFPILKIANFYEQKMRFKAVHYLNTKEPHICSYLKMDPKKTVYWWTSKENYEFKEDHKGECVACVGEATLNEDNVCEDCYIIFIKKMKIFNKNTR